MQDKLELNVINRIKKGEIDSFEFLVKRYERPLFVMVGNMLKDSSIVEDIVQDVFLSAYRNMNAYNPEKGKFSTWLFRIARNKCINAIKKKREILTERIPEIPSNENPSDAFIMKETFIRLDKALLELPFKYRMVFVMAELEELSYAEIAEIEKISIGTVKSRLSRAREKLRTILKETAGERLCE